MAQFGSVTFQFVRQDALNRRATREIITTERQVSLTDQTIIWYGGRKAPALSGDIILDKALWPTLEAYGGQELDLDYRGVGEFAVLTRLDSYREYEASPDYPNGAVVVSAEFRIT